MKRLFASGTSGRRIPQGRTSGMRQAVGGRLAAVDPHTRPIAASEYLLCALPRQAIIDNDDFTTPVCLGFDAGDRPGENGQPP